MSAGSTPASASAARRRGRPSGSDGLTTRDRLVDAGLAACLELGFEQVTLADIARRADVTPAAVYNHFDDKGKLLFAVGRRALEDLTTGAVGSLAEVRTAREIATGYLAPELSSQRRLLLQIHQASERDPELRKILAEWHRRSAERLRPLLAPNADDAITVLKTFYLFLLGLCHLEQLEALDAPHDQMTTRAADLADHLFGTT